MLFEQIFRKFSKRKVRYLVVGGIAVNLHGFGRATGDLDIMLALDDSNIKKFVDVVNDLQFIPRLPVKVEEFADSAKRDLWINEKNMKVFSVYNPKNPIEHIDIMVENYIDFKKAYSNRENMHAGDITIPVVSINDLIELKKISGRDRDLLDIKALAKIKELKDEK